jgi:hypothetical protein
LGGKIMAQLKRHELYRLYNFAQPPILTKPTAINYTDTEFDDSFTTVTGKLLGSDADKDTLTLTFGTAGGTDKGEW